MAQTQHDTPLIPISESKRFISECLQAVGAPKNHADDMGDLLVAADYRGHFSHGMNRLEMYVNDITSGTCDAKVEPKILKETVATAWVDGQNGLGAVVGNFCIAVAIKKAKEVGIGLVTAKHSNHFGINSMYTLQAVKQGLLGMAFTNTSPFVTATRSKKIEIARRKGVPIPQGWAQDKDGRATTDTKTAMTQGSCLMPLGGAELHSGYKGYGLAFLVEIFSAILSGATYGPNIRPWMTTDRIADLGHGFIAINPQCFASDFESRLSDLMNVIRNSEPADPSKPVLVPGDSEKLHMAAIDKAGGIRYLPNQMETCKKLSEQLKVKPLTGS
ncbi:oxidoreductase-related [Holotrichia oblita]|uniref:Oxidoreductase-related n=1 Tax=Holotrichia oblita TaxID=644536 RepID=A0ACB9TJ55_HOLOL|nr:oxidoreductase-related [Holotrichia oblita]